MSRLRLMRVVFLCLAASAGVWSLSLAAPKTACCDETAVKACNGSASCSVCKNCSRCAHCKNGGTCGACEK